MTRFGSQQHEGRCVSDCRVAGLPSYTYVTFCSHSLEQIAGLSVTSNQSLTADSQGVPFHPARIVISTPVFEYLSSPIAQRAGYLAKNYRIASNRTLILLRFTKGRINGWMATGRLVANWIITTLECNISMNKDGVL
ncbi:hypothetical protein BaRGS_00038110 [Batillaria attramentaria]|uniref:Uncharacterized protein n=1 Tax=Batillaria attramentaria TaxID=370345 RepID=A0ABD0J6Q4_9CAEN